MDDHEFSYIQREIEQLLSMDVGSYRRSQLQRRLGVFLLRSGHADWPSFFRAARTDPQLVRKLKDYLTVNVSAFFRDPEKYTYLRESVLPEMRQRRGALRVWSAGCGEGQETYSLAILLAELPVPGQSHYILGTDFDADAIGRAQAGGPYTPEEVAHVAPEHVERYFTPTADGYCIHDDLRRQVQFRQHNLLFEPFGGPFDLIVCRNVLIYFEPEIRQMLYRRFYDALIEGGVFFVGGTEIVPNAEAIGFRSLSVSFYHREINRPTNMPGRTTS
jgi:chemotaxis protein methyltransferase CheR